MQPFVPKNTQNCPHLGKQLHTLEKATPFINDGPWKTCWLLALSPKSLDASTKVPKLDPGVYTKLQGYTITPLVAAIVRGHLALVTKWLTEANVNKIDATGMTPSHWIALIAPDSEMWKLAKDKGMKLDGKTKWGWTVRQVRDWVQYRPENLKLALQANHANKHVPELNAELFKLRYGFFYSPNLVYSIDSLMTLHFKTESKSLLGPGSEIFSKPLHSRVVAFLKRSPSERDTHLVYLTKLVHKSPKNKTPLPEQLHSQWDVRARGTIEPGDIIDIYTGEMRRGDVIEHDSNKVSPIPGTPSVSNALAIDAARYGNLTSLINHGPPNVGGISIEIEGIPVPLNVIVAMRTIKPNERLLLDYGSTYVKKLGTDFVELGEDHIATYFSETKNLTYFAPFNLSSPDYVCAAVTIEQNHAGKFAPTIERHPMPRWGSHEAAIVMLQMSYHGHMATYLHRTHPQEMSKLLAPGAYNIYRQLFPV